MPYALLPIIGFFIGLLLVAIGGGGGSLYVGVLTAFFGVPPATAVTTSLATGMLTTAAGTIGHWRAGNVHFQLAGTMLASGVVGCVAGSLVSNLIPPAVYTVITGLVLLVLAANMLRAFIRNHQRKDQIPDGARNQSDWLRAAAYGLLAGLMSGIMGLSGGGAVTAGLMVLGCGALEIAGTSVLVLLGLAASSFALHATTGAIDWGLVALFSSGTVVGALASPRILARFDHDRLDAVLQPCMIALCAIMGIMVLLR